MNETIPHPSLFSRSLDENMTKDDFETLIRGHMSTAFKSQLGREARAAFMHILMCSTVFPPSPATFDFSAFASTSGATNDSHAKIFVDTAVALGTIKRSFQSGRYEVPPDVHKKLTAIIKRYYIR